MLGGRLREGRGGESWGEAYPGVVELGLDAGHVPLLFVLVPEDPELGFAEGPGDC